MLEVPHCTVNVLALLPELRNSVRGSKVMVAMGSESPGILSPPPQPLVKMPTLVGTLQGLSAFGWLEYSCSEQSQGLVGGSGGVWEADLKRSRGIVFSSSLSASVLNTPESNAEPVPEGRQQSGLRAALGDSGICFFSAESNAFQAGVCPCLSERAKFLRMLPLELPH